jgi:Tol biopolymer transport system component
MRVILSDPPRVVLVIAITAVSTSCAATRSSAPNSSSAQTVRGSFLVASDHGLLRRFPNGKLMQLTTGARDSFPAWSRDGTQIAFVRHGCPYNRCPLFVMKSDGSGVHRVGRVVTDCSGVSWGPGDRRLVFGGGPANENNATLWVVNVDGTGARRLLSGRGANLEGTHPAWSPDGRTIAFGWTASRLSGLLAIRPDGTGLHALVKPRRGHVDALSQPAWSRDGRRLAFARTDFGAPTRMIVVASAQGGDRRALARLPFNPGETGVPSWSPDGALVAFSGYCGRLGCVWTIPRQGGKRRVLFRGPFGQASWGPAGT